MKRLLATAAFLAVAANAQAADIAVKAPYLKAPVAMVYDWTGFYVGVNAGIGVGRNNQTLTFPGFPSFERSYLSPFGALGGVQAGYNWQTNTMFGRLVLGVETDIQGAGLRDDHTCLLTCRAVPDISGRFDQRLDWFGTVRGRVGFANGPVLRYFTGGFAYGNVKTSITENIQLAGFPATFTSNQTRGGWTVGRGVEAALGGNWTAKIEYLQVDLGNKSETFALGGFPQTLDTEIRQNIYRVGLNYRIGGNGAYAHAPAANWTGFYLGGNFGSATARNETSLAVLGTNERFTLAPEGKIGGVQAGYNWQAANWVFGVEADIQGSTQKDNKTCVANCQGLNGSYANYDARLPWFGTVRGRLGYSAGPALLYATGGYAYGSIKTNIDSAFLNGPVTSRFSENKGGWTIGAGIETPATLFSFFGPNWTSKSEYLYVDLGSTSGIIADPGGPAISTTKVTQHIFRSGLNYHFNSPVVAKY
ncbi:outer membrane protein [Bradyrhizobium sp.]|uniref:outer membrane protein n=1 Tax=Bradyrhizobium sp. TaxID=376 RepID=UPI002736013B|nr:outer membrane beta-barrel protein [Bradyrhizobium sp.]MDP3075293.1 outer membrane beta-barrel protein [Bradyrhizobium sp.]